MCLYIYIYVYIYIFLANRVDSKSVLMLLSSYRLSKEKILTMLCLVVVWSEFCLDYQGHYSIYFLLIYYSNMHKKTVHLGLCV